MAIHLADTQIGFHILLAYCAIGKKILFAAVQTFRMGSRIWEAGVGEQREQEIHPHA